MNSKVSIQIERITPQQAASWLKNNNTRNRSVSEKVVKAYAEDIANDRWELTGQTIQFYENGVLADGQHRLSAVVAANKSVLMAVTRGLPVSAINGIDQHRARSIHDTLTLKQGYGKVSATDIATLRLCYPTTKANASLMELMLVSNFENLQKVNAMFGSVSTKTGSAVMRSVVLLALINGENESELSSFVDVLLSGITTEPHHATVVLLRDLVLQDGTRGGDTIRRNFVKKSQLALRRFLEKQTAKRLSEVSYYTYPLLDLGDLNEVSK